MSRIVERIQNALQQWEERISALPFLVDRQRFGCLTLLMTVAYSSRPVWALVLIGFLAAADGDAGVSADVAHLDELWTNRDDPQVEAQIAAMMKQFADSQDYEKLWRVARWYFWQADGAKDDATKKSLGKAGWDIGEKAKKVDSKGLEAKYWTSANIGAYSEAVGIFNALTEGLEAKFRDPLEQCAKADPNHLNANINYVGPQTALGRYYFRLPWPKRNLGKSKQLLQLAVKVRPENLRAHYFLAETLWDDGKKAEAKAELAFIKDGSESYDPPEARRAKRMAQALSEKYAKE
jgi:hypothetical protein